MKGELKVINRQLPQTAVIALATSTNTERIQNTGINGHIHKIVSESS